MRSVQDHSWYVWHLLLRLIIAIAIELRKIDKNKSRSSTPCSPLQLCRKHQLLEKKFFKAVAFIFSSETEQACIYSCISFGL